MLDNYMWSILLTFVATLQFGDLHRQLCIAERYEQAIAISKLVRYDHSIHFWQAVAYFKTGNKVEAKKSLKNYLIPLSDVKLVERYQVVAEKMLEEIEDWKADDMGDISRDMDNSARRLRIGRADQKTKVIQTNIITKLDKMIKDAEDEMNKANQVAGASSPRTQNPIGDSKIMEGPGEGNVENKKLVQSTDVWGKMPEKEKIKAMETINKQLPPHIREAAEGFSKKLNNIRDKR